MIVRTAQQDGLTTEELEQTIATRNVVTSMGASTAQQDQRPAWTARKVSFIIIPRTQTMAVRLGWARTSSSAPRVILARRGRNSPHHGMVTNVPAPRVPIVRAAGTDTASTAATNVPAESIKINRAKTSVSSASQGTTKTIR